MTSDVEPLTDFVFVFAADWNNVESASFCRQPFALHALGTVYKGNALFGAAVAVFVVDQILAFLSLLVQPLSVVFVPYVKPYHSLKTAHFCDSLVGLATIPT